MNNSEVPVLLGLNVTGQKDSMLPQQRAAKQSKTLEAQTGLHTDHRVKNTLIQTLMRLRNISASLRRSC